MKQQATDDMPPQFIFIKGIGILSIIFARAGVGLKYLSPYWIGIAVPLFVCVSCALNCMDLSKNSSIKNYFNFDKIKTVFVRMVFPFILAQILMALALVAIGNFSIKDFIAGGGIGYGSYYLWVYLQLWVIMPFMFLLIKKNFIVGILATLLVSIGMNMLFSVFSSADWLHLSAVSLYRLCVNRYLFIYPLIFLLVEKKIKYNILLFLGFISAGFIFCISYKNINLEPIIFNSGWQVYEFPSVFYTLLAFIFLCKAYDYIPKIIQKIICKIGANSWEIYILQMIYFTFCGYLNIDKHLNLVLGLFICIMPIYSYKFMAKPLELK
jgi:hypothetical protein